VNDRRRLTERTVHRGHACHVRVRGDDDGRGLGLELARRHVVLRLRLVVRVPLLHVRHLLRVAVRRAIVVVGRVGVVIDGRVCLRRWSIVVLLVRVLHLLPALVVWPTGRNVAWHHGRQATMLPRCRALVSKTKRPTGEATGTCAEALAWIERLSMGDATGLVRAGRAGDDDAVEYYADEGRATGGVEGQAAGWQARLAVIVSARHERSRDCPGMGDARMRGWKVGVVVGLLRPVMEFAEVELRAQTSNHPGRTTN
jgi:hypothetical protein